MILEESELVEKGFMWKAIVLLARTNQELLYLRVCDGLGALGLRVARPIRSDDPVLSKPTRA